MTHAQPHRLHVDLDLVGVLDESAGDAAGDVAVGGVRWMERVEGEGGRGQVGLAVAGWNRRGEKKQAKDRVAALRYI